MPQDFSIKYGGRAFKFDVIVNTDEDLNVIASRLITAARGEKLNAVVIGVAKLTLAELMTVFHTAQGAADSGKGTPINRS